ncbi:CRISPR-associated helicase Cas3' [Bacteroides heparinolyticus]|uniref:CRISPR-associated helicase Cas3' n=1 Tax=Prevotella heparinolytica TaxID=28113 RepID=UPI0035A03A39
MGVFDYILAKHEDNGATPLAVHLRNVSSFAVTIAQNLGLNEEIARKGALLHDIGKVSPVFQQRLKRRCIPQPGSFFRHEIASLFFISLIGQDEKDAVIEMIVAHHKSIIQDVRELGLLDLEENEDSFTVHAKDFEKWSSTALAILSELGLETHEISIEEARENYEYAVEYCQGLVLQCSAWKGVLMAADHLASALNDRVNDEIQNMFIKPDLSFYNRTHDLYPLSKITTDDNRKHTLVTAPTGAGKTDFLLRRCKGRVFYTLPFQASINAMYDRIKSDLNATEAQVHLLHAASNLKLKDCKLEERIIQRHVGASVKVLTPHQMAAIVYGIKGYEAMAVDLRGCDVILDEIHTYSDVIQAIVLRIIEVLVSLDCRIHVGTATMPSVLYERILGLLGGKNNVYEVKLSDEILTTFNRHIIHKEGAFDECSNVIETAVKGGQKILVVCNQVKRAQEIFKTLKEQYPDVKSMLIHGRFKRGKRQSLEEQLKLDYNTMNGACIVVSTQVVEVSLDISFDLMITECAPIDALIQRFGRINRKRTFDTIGQYKPIYVVEPPEDKMEALPYSLDILKRSFDVLPDNTLMQEAEVQSMLDNVYPDIDFTNIDYSGVAFADGQWMLKKLCHRAKSALLDTLEIDSAVCITESDKDLYKQGFKLDRSELEIPVSYRSIGFRNLEQLEGNTRPFVIPDKAYSEELGFLSDYAKPEFYNSFEIL